jgi:hypothetical protein
MEKRPRFLAASFQGCKPCRRNDPKVKEGRGRQLLERLPVYSSVDAAAEATARRGGPGKETTLRWVVPAQIAGRQRPGAISLEPV